MRSPNLTHGSLLTAVVLAACQPTEPEPAEEATSHPTAAPSLAAPPSAAAASADANRSPVELIGEYRVAGIDGQPLDAPIGIALSISTTTIELAPCAGLVWDYDYEGGALETKRSPRKPDQPICRITPEIAAAGTAIDAATLAQRTPSNGIEFSGGGHSLTLFSQ